MGRGVHRSALFLPGSQFPYRLEGGNLEVGGGDSSVLLVRGLSCSFLLGLRIGEGQGVGKENKTYQILMLLTMAPFLIWQEVKGL